MIKLQVMGKVLGIIGGGQLGMMLTEAAKNFPEISEIVVLDPTPNCPATQVGARHLIGDFKSKEHIIQLANQSDIITYEIESGDSDVLELAQQYAEINPLPSTLKVIQDKLLQKQFLQTHDIPVPDFVQIDTLEDLRSGLDKFGYPALLKIRRDAYDGRGNYKIDTPNDLEVAFNSFNGRLFLERFINFKLEISVIAARNTLGEISTYPPVENIHESNILRQTIAPARIDDITTQRAIDVAYATMSILKGAGVFGIEMFVTQEDSILINEIAPRVHNSGHHSLQSSLTSQFEQHLRAILGKNLGSTKLIHNTIMYNILGSHEFQGRYKPPVISTPNIFLKMYGKEISKPMRKLGHLNIVGTNGETIDDLLKVMDKIKTEALVHPV